MTVTADLSEARILLTNDDGLHAPGLEVLAEIARTLSPEVWIVAPESEQSAASHSLTITRPLRLRAVAERRYAVDGTPTDCVLLAINHLLQDKRPTLVLSGVNQGSNLGEDVTYSGTIAAAMEATLLGVPALALSLQTEDSMAPLWATPRRWGAEAVRRALRVAWPAGVLMNINFPNIAADAVRGMRAVQHGKRKIGDNLIQGIDPRGRPYFWIGSQRSEEIAAGDSDITAIVEGYISVTPLQLDLTHHATLGALAQALV